MKHSKYWKSLFRFEDAEDKNFQLIFFAFIIGGVVGLFGAFFRVILMYVETHRLKLFQSVNHDIFWQWILPVVLVVAAGVIAVYIVKRFAPEAAGSGVHEIEGALDDIRPLRWKRVIPVKFFASLFSLGGGFLLGREGPTIQLGASIGKMIRDVFKQPENKNNPLISAGAAAGLASAFNAPFSGIIFVMEEMHGHFKYSFFSLSAIMLASATADIVVRMIVGGSVVIEMTVFTMPPLSVMWMFVLLGIIFALVGLAFNKSLLFILDFFGNMSKHMNLISVAAIGLFIAVLGIFFPEMIGGGYHTISMALKHSYTMQFMLFLFLGRMVLTLFSYGVGLPGGIFAPLLALGVVLGMLFGGIMEYYFPGQIDQTGVFAVAGMAAIFAATVRAPVTGIILAVEMTSNYELLLPLIFTVVTASLLTTQMGNQPIYTTLLERTMQREHDKANKKLEEA